MSHNNAEVWFRTVLYTSPLQYCTQRLHTQARHAATPATKLQVDAVRLRTRLYPIGALAMQLWQPWQPWSRQIRRWCKNAHLTDTMRDDKLHTFFPHGTLEIALVHKRQASHGSYGQRRIKSDSKRIFRCKPPRQNDAQQRVKQLCTSQALPLTHSQGSGVSAMTAMADTKSK